MLHTAKVPTIVTCLESIHHIKGLLLFVFIMILHSKESYMSINKKLEPFDYSLFVYILMFYQEFELTP